jgi:hypothetical protein
MNRLLKNLAAASFLIGLPLAAAAHDDRYRGDRDGRHYDQHYKHPHKYKQPHARNYYPTPPVVYHRPAPPRVVGYPVYVPPPRPWPLNQVDIGFRIFF